MTAQERKNLSTIWGTVKGILKSLHDDSSTAVQFSLLDNQRYELPEAFKELLQTLISLPNKELRDKFLQTIEDEILDTAHQGSDKLGLVYAGADGKIVKCADINKDLAMLAPELISTYTFTVVTTTPVEAPTSDPST